MIAGYIMVFWAVYALLPLAIDASMACNAPGSMTNAVTQKAENGSALCATSAPTKTVAADIKLLCLDACLRHASCEDGFNYHEETKLCEMYSDQPTNYQVQPNCSYLKVINIPNEADVQTTAITTDVPDALATTDTSDAVQTTAMTTDVPDISSTTDASDNCTVLMMQKIDEDGDFFDKVWADFKAGFGDVTGRYWLGNDQIHELTKDGGYKLRVDLEAYDGPYQTQTTWFWAEYTTFVVGNEASNYVVMIDGYSGDSGNILAEINGTQFTTYDRDNDGYNFNCAGNIYGGFWHDDDCVQCAITGGNGYFNCESLSAVDKKLKKSQMWLQCK